MIRNGHDREHQFQRHVVAELTRQLGVGLLLAVERAGPEDQAPDDHADDQRRDDRADPQLTVQLGFRGDAVGPAEAEHLRPAAAAEQERRPTQNRLPTPPTGAHERSRWRLLEVGEARRILRSVDHAGEREPATGAAGPTWAPSHAAYWRGVRTAGLPDRPVRDPSPELVDAVSGASHLMRHRGPDEPGTWSDDRPTHRRAGFQPAVDHRHRAQPPAAALGPARDAGPLRAGVQRRDLQLPRVA